MACMSQYLENKLLNYVLKGSAFADPSGAIYMALFTADPSDTGGGTEVSGGSYARKSIATTDWTTATTGQITNGSDITMITATGSWGTVTSFGIFDASTSGNLLFWGTLSASKTIGSGDIAKFAAGDLVINPD